MNRGDLGLPSAVGMRFIKKRYLVSATLYTPSDTQPWSTFDILVCGGPGPNGGTSSVVFPSSSSGQSSSGTVSATGGGNGTPGTGSGGDVNMVGGGGSENQYITVGCYTGILSSVGQGGVTPISGFTGGTASAGVGNFGGGGGGAALATRNNLPPGYKISITVGSSGYVEISFWTQDVNP